MEGNFYGSFNWHRVVGSQLLSLSEVRRTRGVIRDPAKGRFQQTQQERLTCAMQTNQGKYTRKADGLRHEYIRLDYPNRFNLKWRLRCEQVVPISHPTVDGTAVHVHEAPYRLSAILRPSTYKLRAAVYNIRRLHPYELHGCNLLTCEA